MEQHNLISLIALLVLIYSVIAVAFYKIGRYQEKQNVIHLYKKITSLTQDKSRLYQMLKRLRKVYVMELQNNDRVIESLGSIYEQGKIDIIKRLGDEMMKEHDPMMFVKLPKKNTLNTNEGGENDCNNSSDRSGNRGIHLSLN